MWASTHKVWTAVIILVVIGILASPRGQRRSSEGCRGEPIHSALSSDASHFSRGADRRQVVPTVIGKDLGKATTALEQMGLTVTVTRSYSDKPAGTVLRSSVKEGASPGRSGHGRHPCRREADTQSAERRWADRQAAATSKLKHAGYEVIVTKQESSATAGRVLRSSPAAGSSRLPGKPVTIVVAKPAPPDATSGAGSCTAGYSPCLPPASDYDCAGGSGHGREYVYGTVTVTGSDPYGLDADGDGYGCE